MVDQHGSDGTNGTIDRRTFLATTAGTATTVGLATSAAAAADDYELVEVPEGETHRIDIGDGETISNLLIDISAPGAGYEIAARADDWEISNVGVRGSWDHVPGTQPFRVSVQSEDATGVIDTVYLGDGVDDVESWDPSDDPSGIWTHWTHAGELDVHRCNVQEFPDNGFYCSQAGNSSDHPNPGGGGVVRVHDSYSAYNKTSNMRLGTEGSYAENCVLWGHYHRGHWNFYNETALVDCDIGPVGPNRHLDIGTDTWSAGADCSVTVENTRFDDGAVRTRRGAELDGAAAGEPVHRMPEGCPTTATEAASGST